MLRLVRYRVHLPGHDLEYFFWKLLGGPVLPHHLFFCDIASTHLAKGVFYFHLRIPAWIESRNRLEPVARDLADNAFVCAEVTRQKRKTKESLEIRILSNVFDFP